MTAGHLQDTTQAISRDRHGRFIGSGNPAGHVRSRQHREMLDAYAREFGGTDNLSPSDRIELEEAIGSLIRAKRANHTDAVRLKRDAREWLDGIRMRHTKAKHHDATPLDRYLTDGEVAA